MSATLQEAAYVVVRGLLTRRGITVSNRTPLPNGWAIDLCADKIGGNAKLEYRVNDKRTYLVLEGDSNNPELKSLGEILARLFNIPNSDYREMK